MKKIAYLIAGLLATPALAATPSQQVQWGYDPITGSIQYKLGTTWYSNFVSNVLPYANGGTGITALGTANQCLTTNGTVTGMAWASCSTGGGSLAVGTSTVTGGTNTYVLYNNAGVLGNATIPALLGSPSLIAGANIAITGTWPNQTITAAGGSGGGGVGGYYAQAITPTGTNTFPSLSQSYTTGAGSAVMIVNGVSYTDHDASPCFSVTSSVITWSAANCGFSVTTSDKASIYYTQSAGGGVNSGIAGQLAYYAGSGSVVSGLSLGTNLSITGSTLNAAGGGGSGTVTSASVVSANGFAGSVATATTTPAITLSTTVTGVLKGNGTAISAASAGTDYLAPSALTTALPSATTSQLYGGTGAAGAAGAVTVGSGLSLSAGTLTASGGSSAFPLTVSGTVTSGGIPYFASTTSMATSGVLTAGMPVLGGGAGAAPTVGTLSGNTTKVVTTTGTLTTGHCVQIDAAGNMVDAGGACTTGGGGGTVTSGTANQLAFYGSTGTTVSGLTSGTAGQFLVENASAVPTFVTASGDCTIASSGAITCTKINSQTVSLAGSFTMSGAFTFAGTLTGATAVTFPTTGTLATTANINTALPSATSSQIYIGTGGAGVAAASSVLPTAAVPAFTGDVTNTAGSLATTVGKIGGNAVSLGGALTTSGAFATTLTATGTTSVTLPTSGTLATTANINTALPSATTSQVYIGTGGAGVAAAGNVPAAALPAATSSTFGGVKPDGTTIANATGVISLGLSNVNTWTGTQTLNGTSSTFASVLANAAETATVSATAATGTINFYLNSQSVLYYTTNASANWTVNFALSSGTSLNTALATGQSVTAVFLVTQGASAFFNNAVTIDGSAVTPKWQGGTAPAAGNASGIDVYTYTIIKTASATYTVLASQTQFK